MQKIRALKANEIEVRVQQVTEKGAQLLVYKDSRCDKRILDETFGILGWKNKYEEIKVNLYCTISIWDEDSKQWVDKCDCGVESFSEKEKGEASDAFKRAGFNVGIGRELYTRIFYFANVPTIKNDKGKFDLKNKYEKFRVSEIETNEEQEKIEKIKIVDSKDKVVFSYGYKKPETTEIIEMPKPANESAKVTKKEVKATESEEKPANPKTITDAQKKLINTLLSKQENREQAKKDLYAKFNITTIKGISSDLAKQMIESLKGDNNDNNK